MLFESEMQLYFNFRVIEVSFKIPRYQMFYLLSDFGYLFRCSSLTKLVTMLNLNQVSLVDSWLREVLRA